MEEQDLSNEAADYVNKLEVALKELTALPLVSNCVLIGSEDDKNLNLICVRANLRSEFVPNPSRRSPHVACSKLRPTQLDAAITLLEKLKTEYEEELRRAAAAAPRPTDAKDATSFNRLKAASLRHHDLTSAVSAAEKAVSDAHKALHQAAIWGCVR